jgi:hypothetical protein
MLGSKEIRKYLQSRGPMKRREFMIALSGATGMWAFETSAQRPLLPIIGHMSSRSAGDIDQNRRWHLPST